MNRAIGIILVVIGILTLLWTELGSTPKDRTIDDVMSKITFDKDNSATNWPLYIGGFCLVSGFVVIILSKKEDSPY